MIAPLLPGTARTGRPRRTDLRAVNNALRYMVRTGCESRMLPNDFALWQTVYYWFRGLMRRMMFRAIYDLSLMLDRLLAEIDSQSVKAPAARERRYDANKKIKGRTRHIAVDTDGRLLAVNLTPEDMADSTGAGMVLPAMRERWPWGQTPVWRRRLRSTEADRQGGISGFHRRGGATSEREVRFCGAAATLGGRTQLCRAAALAPCGK